MHGNDRPMDPRILALLREGYHQRPKLSTQEPGKKSGGPARIWRYRDRLHHRHDHNIAIDGWAPR
jgi:hypothetical protein